MPNIPIVAVLEGGVEVKLEMDERGWMIDVEGRMGFQTPGDRFRLYPGDARLTHVETGVPVPGVVRLIRPQDSKKARERTKATLIALERSTQALERAANG